MTYLPFPKHLLKHLVPFPPPTRPLRIRRDNNLHGALQRAAKHAHLGIQDFCIIVAIVAPLAPYWDFLSIIITIAVLILVGANRAIMSLGVTLARPY